MQAVGDEANGHGGVTQQVFGLIDAARLDVGLRRLAQGALHDAVQVVGRNAQLFGVEVHARLGGEILVDQLLKANHTRLDADWHIALHRDSPLKQRQDLIKQGTEQMDAAVVGNLNLDFDKQPDDLVVHGLVEHQIRRRPAMGEIRQAVDEVRVVEER